MTPEREKALESVAEAARRLEAASYKVSLDRDGAIFWLTLRDAEFDTRRALATLDALPAEPPSGEGEASERTLAQKLADVATDRVLVHMDKNYKKAQSSLMVVCLMALRDDIHQLTAAIREGKR